MLLQAMSHCCHIIIIIIIYYYYYRHYPIFITARNPPASHGVELPVRNEPLVPGQGWGCQLCFPLAVRAQESCWLLGDKNSRVCSPALVMLSRGSQLPGNSSGNYSVIGKIITR